MTFEDCIDFVSDFEKTNCEYNEINETLNMKLKDLESYNRVDENTNYAMILFSQDSSVIIRIGHYNTSENNFDFISYYENLYTELLSDLDNSSLQLEVEYQGKDFLMKLFIHSDETEVIVENIKFDGMPSNGIIFLTEYSDFSRNFLESGRLNRSLKMYKLEGNSYNNEEYIEIVSKNSNELEITILYDISEVEVLQICNEIFTFDVVFTAD